MAKPKVGVIVPNRWVDQIPEPEELADYFQRVEELGFHSLWITDRPLHRQVSMPNPLIMLTYAAAHTKRVRLGTSVLLLNLRHPVDVARQAATLDKLSGGRLTLGVAPGGREDEYPAMNSPKNERVGRLEEGIAVLRKLWTEEDVTFHGRYYHLEEANVLPKPLQPGGIPIMTAGHASELSFRRAGRLADGWIMGTVGDTPQWFAHGWQVVQEAAQEAGRDPSKLTNAKLLYVNPDEDRDRAQRELDAHLNVYYPYILPHAIVIGPPQKIAEAVQAYGEVGCQEVVLFLPWLNLAKLERLAEATALVS